MLQFLIFSVFIVFVLGLVWLDLRSSNGNGLTSKQALIRTFVWFTLGLSFSLILLFFYHNFWGFNNTNQMLDYAKTYNKALQINELNPIQSFNKSAALLYITGFFLEYSLSMDNLFVILLIFSANKLNNTQQRLLLNWGIWGAVIMRFIFIFLGSSLIQQFHWTLYLFGAFLIYSGAKAFFTKESTEDYNANDNKIVKFLNRLLPIKSVNKDIFWFKESGKLWFTPLFIILIIVELTDVIFAVDSVPAVFGITQDPYLVFFSNIFAIIGLRSLFFVLSNSMDKFYALKYGLSIILIFIGVKMLAEPWFLKIGFTHLHNLFTLIGILLLSIVYSLLFPKKEVI